MTGLLFQALPKQPATLAIAAAIARFTERFGKRPTHCRLNPQTILVPPVPPIRLVPDRHIQPGQFWLGPVEELIK